jgi:hypothetical protein
MTMMLYTPSLRHGVTTNLSQNLSHMAARGPRVVDITTVIRVVKEARVVVTTTSQSPNQNTTGQNHGGDGTNSTSLRHQNQRTGHLSPNFTGHLSPKKTRTGHILIQNQRLNPTGHIPIQSLHQSPTGIIIRTSLAKEVRVDLVGRMAREARVDMITVAREAKEDMIMVAREAKARTMSQSLNLSLNGVRSQSPIGQMTTRTLRLLSGQLNGPRQIMQAGTRMGGIVMGTTSMTSAMYVNK